MLPSVTDYVRVEHERLRSLMDTARDAAEAVGAASLRQLADGVDKTLQVVYEELLPQLEAEQAVLYPVVTTLTESEVPVALLTSESVRIGRIARRLLRARARLGGLDSDDDARLDLRAALYDIYFAVKSHLSKEDEVLPPLLARHLSRRQDARLLEDLRGAVEEARRVPALL